MSYRIKEAFYTVQGEGFHAGTPAVFIRFAGCNLWSGREQDRERDALKGGCARWCDTDFLGTNGENGGTYSRRELATLAFQLGGDSQTVVLTGGEPTLQVDADIVGALRAGGFAVHIETNGTRPSPAGIDWITVSPKPPSRPLVLRYDEVKAVLCGEHDVEQWTGLAPIRSLQPLWSADVREQAENVRRCIDYVMAHPHWRLSLQTHKMVGLQ